MSDPAPVTIGEVRTSGRRLGMYCQACNRFRYLALDRYEDGTLVGEIGKTLICSRCRSKGVEAKVIERDPKSGFWPAEFA